MSTMTTDERLFKMWLMIEIMHPVSLLFGNILGMGMKFLVWPEFGNITIETKDLKLDYLASEDP